MDQNANFENANNKQEPELLQGGGERIPEAAVTENVMPTYSVACEKETFLPEAVIPVPAAPAAEPAAPAEAPSPAAATEASPAKQGENKKKSKKKQRRPRKKRYIARFFGGIFRFLLALLLGMTIAYGSIFFAVYYGISGFTLSDLQALGLLDGIDQDLTAEGEVDLTTVSLLQLVADLNAVRADLGSHTLQTLITRYGLRLPEEVMAKLPTELFAVPLNKLMSNEAGSVVAENLKLGYFLSFLPEGALGKEAIATLASRPLSLLLAGQYAEILSGLKLGYVTGVNFSETGEVIYQNPEAPTTQEALAHLDLGMLFTAVTENGDVLGTLATCVGDSLVKDVLFGLSGEGLLDKMLEDCFVKDIVVFDEARGAHVLNFNALTEGVYLGDAFGYTLVDGEWYSSYTDDGDDTNDVKVGAMLAALANAAFADIFGGNLDLFKTFEGLYLGDLQVGYVRGDAIIEVVDDVEVIVGYQWTKNGAALSQVEKKLANLAIADVLNGSLDITAALGDLYLGDLQGYTRSNVVEGDVVIGYKWVKVATDLTETELSAMEAAIADISLSSILGGSLDISAVLGDVTIGEVQGYTLGNDGKWYQPVGDPAVLTYVGAVQNSLAGTKLSAVLGGSFTLTAAIGDLRIGDAMGYERGEVITPADPLDSNSYDIFAFTKGESAEAVTGAILEVANMPLANVLEGRADFADTIKGMRLGEVLEYTEHDGKWYTVYTDNGNDEDDVLATGILALLAGYAVRELNASTVDGLLLGDILGYEHRDTDANGVADTWYKGGAAAEGLMAIFADLTVGNLSDSNLITAKVRTLTLAEAMGYEQHNGAWYSTYSDDGNDANDVKITGLLASLAGKPLNTINAATIDEILLGEALGYTYVDTNDDGEGDTWYNGSTPAFGMMATLADLTVAQLRDSSAVTACFGDVYLYDVLGYHKEGDAWYRNSDNHKASGIIAHLIGLKIGEVEGELDGMALGYAFNLYRDEETGVWYTDAAHTTEPTGITAVLADMTISSVQSDFEAMKIGTVLGFSLVDTDDDGEADTWQKKNGEALTGLDLVFADMLLSDLSNSNTISAALQSAKLGDTMGYTYVDTNDDGEGDTWYNGTQPATGLFGALAGSSIGSIDADVQTVSIGVMMNYSKRGDKWYDSEGNEVTGMVTAIADSTLATIGEDFENITIGTLYPQRDGILKAVDGDTKISELDSVVAGLTMGDLVSKGVINISIEAQSSLDSNPLLIGWRQMSVVAFLEKIINLVAMMY